MWCRMETVTKSSLELCLTMVFTCPSLLLWCCCCAAVAVLLLLMCFFALLLLLCVRVRGEIVGFVGKRTTAKACATDVSLIKDRGQGIEEMNWHRLDHKPCRLEDGRRQFYDSFSTL